VVPEVEKHATVGYAEVLSLNSAEGTRENYTEVQSGQLVTGSRLEPANI
jgi:hypothetical protein